MPVPQVSRAHALVRACHPAPTVVVTTSVTALAAGAGRDPRGCIAVAVTVLVGQLSIGWSNDALDATRDRAVGRADKPVAAGELEPRGLLRLAVLTLVVAVGLSFLVAGARGGTCHVVLVASGWAYNLGLKSTRWSLLPYAVGFGVVPGFVTYGLDPGRAPSWWATAVAALLGVAAGLANAAPDVDDDRVTGVHGAVGRLGARTARAWCAIVVATATVVIVVFAGLTAAGSATLVAMSAAALAAGWLLRDGAHLFAAVLVVVLVDVGIVVAAL